MDELVVLGTALSMRRSFVTGAQSEMERQVGYMHQTCLDSVVWGPAGVRTD